MKKIIKLYKKIVKKENYREEKVHREEREKCSIELLYMRLKIIHRNLKILNFLFYKQHPNTLFLLLLSLLSFLFYFN